MGNEGIHAPGTSSEVEASYTVMAYGGSKLPAMYQGFIYAKWMKSLRNGNDFFKLADPAAFYQAYRNYIQTLLLWDNAIVRVAVLSDEPDVLLGFSVCRGKTLDYVYVNKDQRKLGISSFLVPADIEQFSHVTKSWLPIWGAALSRYKKCKFNPFA